MAPNPANRRSGEHVMPEGATEDIRVLAATMQLGIQGIRDELARHIDDDQRRADKIDQRLEQGSSTMAGISADVKVIISRLDTAASSLRGSKRSSDDTSRANPALQPKKDPWWLREIARTIIAILVTAAVTYLLVHGPAVAKLVTPGVGP